jgi:hypothetical protein
MKHTIEEKEALIEILEHPGLPPLLRELDGLKEAMSKAVLQFEISDAELLKRKCHLDGAHKLLSDFKRRLDTLKAKEKISKA